MKINRGFTLVELLIVIALIGILAVAVLAAINPLEQMNRARDTGMKSDASQLLAAIDRYYASQEEFTWVAVDPNLTNDDAYGFASAQAQGVGICGIDCTANGILLDALELKSEYRNRKFITATSEVEMLYIGKDKGASTSVYACWVPRSNAERLKASYKITLGTPSRTTGCTATDWSSLGTACLVCIPE